jgi:hypothetical protein
MNLRVKTLTMLVTNRNGIMIIKLTLNHIPLVMLYDPKRKVGISPKLQCSWDGPYVITHCISDLVYRIQKAESAKPRVVYYNRLKPYHGDYDNWLDKHAVINDTDVQTSDNEQITVSDNKLAESEHFSENEETALTEYGRGHRVRRPLNRYSPDLH